MTVNILILVLIVGLAVLFGWLTRKARKSGRPLLNWVGALLSGLRAELVTSGQAESVFSARHVEGYTWRMLDDMAWPMHTERMPRQQRTVATVEENGSIYVFRPAILLQGGSRVGGRVMPYLMHPLDSFQLDEPGDIPFIEELMELRLGCERSAASR